jgi:hypothetical protein
VDPTTDGIHWPSEFDPNRAPIHVRNELKASASASSVWAWLVRARDWPSWYPNSQAVRLEGGVSNLGAGMTFRWRTFGVSLVSRVKEFVPEERIAWTAKGIGVWANHAWLILPAASGCTIVTEETQYGFASRLGALFMPSRMHRLHQVWLEGLAQKARDGLPKT